MHSDEITVRLMPDVATQTRAHPKAALDWVGMDGIEVPLYFDAGDGQMQRVNARVGVFVNLTRADQRGIHMSRLYLLVDEHLGMQSLKLAELHALLRTLLASQCALSDHGHLNIRFDVMVRRAAPHSANSGWRSYPVSIDAYLGPDGCRLGLETEVLYSSTCPASAALSRQLIQEQFIRDFQPGQALDHAAVHALLGSEQGIVATPHAQRSVARLQVGLANESSFRLLDLIDLAEQSLGTAVQVAVKREDEQAFALANGRNLMFCEDAARRIQKVLDADADFMDFHVRVEHQESLHPYNVLAQASSVVARAVVPEGTSVSPARQTFVGKTSKVFDDAVMREDGSYTLPATVSIDLPQGYQPTLDEEYMCPRQLAYFRNKLNCWREQLVEDSRQTMDNLRDEVRDVGDEAERATRETENSLELRTRDRYRKLISKIDRALRRIEEGRYGYCEETDEEIGIKRLDARPIATLSLDAQERREHLQKQMGD